VSVLDAIDSRTGVRALLARARDLPIGGGPSWRHALGFALAGLVLVQLVTGLAMTFYYSPGATSSWESVLHLETRVLLGSLVRGLHAFGASGVVVLAVVHVVAAALSAAYRRPREAAWLSGLALAPALLGFALTGYLLPWDQKGYWATQVAIGIARATPLVGHAAGQVLQGGPELGTLTLTRFYALHTVVLPLALALLAVVHLALVRRAAMLPDAGATAPWWPGQAWRDALLFTGAVVVVAALAAARGAGLEAPADPTSAYQPRPEWYFSPLRQLLKTVPEPWGSLVLPGLPALLLAALPWLDRAERPRPRLARAIVLGPLALAAALGLKATMDDSKDELYLASREAAEADAALARELAKDGVIGSAAEELAAHPPRRGARLFGVHCQGCHQVGGKGGEEGPDLGDYLSTSWLEGVIRTPRDARFFGHTKLDGMEPLPREEWSKLRPLAAFLQAQDPERAPRPDAALVKAGEEAYFALECHGCHALEKDEAGSAPNLLGYGSREWLSAFLKNPGHARFYGEANEMPAYADELDDDEVAALVTYLRGLAR
jgi:ubiquinol-cytochrome c reductase cytochrome b subunit